MTQRTKLKHDAPFQGGFTLYTNQTRAQFAPQWLATRCFLVGTFIASDECIHLTFRLQESP